MKKVFFSADPIWANQILGLIRIIVGLFMIYHGWEVFDKELMEGYVTREVFKDVSSARFLVYLGKGAELVGGILLTIGFLTRIACIILAGTMLFITFVMGQGVIWYGDQHPFLFVLLAVIFFFVGPGSFSVDRNNR